MSESKEISVIAQVCQAIKSAAMQQQIGQALPPSVSIERFTRTTLVAIQTKPEILKADRQSLYNSIVRAAQDGLIPDGREGALVEFNTNVGTKQKPEYVKKVQFMPMVFGIIQMLGKAEINASAHSVYEGEEMHIWNDDGGQHFKHVRNPFAESRKMIGVYAVAITKNGDTYIEPMNLADIEAVRLRSKQPDSGPWADSFDRMAQKAALHRLAKRVPMRDAEAREQVDRVLKADEETFTYGDAGPPEGDAELQPLKRASSLQSVVDSVPQEDAIESTAEDII